MAWLEHRSLGSYRRAARLNTHRREPVDLRVTVDRQVADGR
jgi:hypothetical protein